MPNPKTELESRSEMEYKYDKLHHFNAIETLKEEINLLTDDYRRLEAELKDARAALHKRTKREDQKTVSPRTTSESANRVHLDRK